jgi:membrane protein
MQVQGVLNTIFQVPDDKRPSGVMGFLIKRGTGVVAVLVLAVLAISPIVAVAAVGVLPDEWGLLKTVLQFSVPIVALLVLLGVVGATFQFLTSVTIPWRAALVGGAATAATGLIAALGAGLYLTRQAGGGGGTSAMSALGGAAILLFFFNLMWIVYVFGAEVTKVYADYLEHGNVVTPSERAQRARKQRLEAEAVSAPTAATESVAKASLFAFVAGALIGLVGSRRR